MKEKKKVSLSKYARTVTLTTLVVNNFTRYGAISSDQPRILT